MHEALLELLPVESNGETVHLVLDVRQQPKDLGIGLQAHHTRREAEQQLVGAVTVVLGQARNGDVDVQLILYNLAYHLHLSLAAIGDDEVGQRLALFDKT